MQDHYEGIKVTVTDQINTEKYKDYVWSKANSNLMLTLPLVMHNNKMGYDNIFGLAIKSLNVIQVQCATR